MLIKPTIIIADCHKTFREGLISILTTEHIATVIAEASDSIEFLELLSHLRPDLALMNVDMPDMNGVETTQKALELIPDLKIIAFTMFGDEECYYKMMDLGVKVLILKSSGISEIEKAIHHVLSGKSYFSEDLHSLPLNHSIHREKMKLNKYQSFTNNKFKLNPEILNIH
jgi:DNA-binding NarL/FixJ family response regulator